jgi:hypothetical protein
LRVPAPSKPLLALKKAYAAAATKNIAAYVGVIISYLLPFCLRRIHAAKYNNGARADGCSRLVFRDARGYGQVAVYVVERFTRMGICSPVRRSSFNIRRVEGKRSAISKAAWRRDGGGGNVARGEWRRKRGDIIGTIASGFMIFFFFLHMA